MSGAKILLQISFKCQCLKYLSPLCCGQTWKLCLTKFDNVVQYLQAFEHLRHLSAKIFTDGLNKRISAKLPISKNFITQAFSFQLETICLVSSFLKYCTIHNQISSNIVYMSACGHSLELRQIVNVTKLGLLH